MIFTDCAIPQLSKDDFFFPIVLSIGVSDRVIEIFPVASILWPWPRKMMPPKKPRNVTPTNLANAASLTGAPRSDRRTRDHSKMSQEDAAYIFPVDRQGRPSMARDL